MIGVFDSGFGGLTVLKQIRELLPQYDYLYLGDNARAPYGTRSFEVVYEYTWACVQYLFERGCNLVVLACNTASAKALRSIQQRNLPAVWAQDQANHWLVPPSGRRVLGVIRPTVEVLNRYTKTGHIGVMGTPGTIASGSYPMEIAKLYPDLVVCAHACPMWVPLVEYGEYDHSGADWFVEKYIQELLAQDAQIDTIVLACTHYPLLYKKIRQYTPASVRLLVQGDLVAAALQDYLQRHQDLENTCTKGGTCTYLTTESASKFSLSARLFVQDEVEAHHIEL